MAHTCLSPKGSDPGQELQQAVRFIEPGSSVEGRGSERKTSWVEAAAWIEVGLSLRSRMK